MSTHYCLHEENVSISIADGKLIVSREMPISEALVAALGKIALARGTTPIAEAELVLDEDDKLDPADEEYWVELAENKYFLASEAIERMIGNYGNLEFDHHEVTQAEFDEAVDAWCNGEPSGDHAAGVVAFRRGAECALAGDYGNAEEHLSQAIRLWKLEPFDEAET